MFPFGIRIILIVAEKLKLLIHGCHRIAAQLLQFLIPQRKVINQDSPLVNGTA